MNRGKFSIIGIVVVLIMAVFMPLSYGMQPSSDIWNKISIKMGTTDMHGGGKYVSIKSNHTVLEVLYGSKEHNNSVKILVGMERYVGGIRIYNENGTLIDKKILRYHAFIGQSFNYIGEVEKINNSKTLIKYVALKGDWNFSGLKITNISANRTLINFTLSMNDVPYTKVYNNSGIGDGVVNKIALHFHITAQLQKKNIYGFPWYSYRPGKGVSMDGKKNYRGDVVTFTIKYDKEIDGWDYVNSSSKIVVSNNIFWGISGNKKVVHLIMEKYGDCRAEMNDHFYDNRTLPHHRVLFRHGGDIVFTEIGEWQRIGRFRWESNVTVDNVNKTAYYQIVGGEKVTKWFDHRIFYLTVLNGMLIYPAGSSIFQDPSIEINDFYINFEKCIIPSDGLSFLGLILLTVFLVGIVIYRFKK